MIFSFVKAQLRKINKNFMVSNRVSDTLSEPSDVEVRVSALEQQLRHRKSELAKLKREYQKNQKERLRSTEKSLINQIQVCKDVYKHIL